MLLTKFLTTNKKSPRSYWSGQDLNNNKKKG